MFLDRLSAEAAPCPFDLELGLHVSVPQQRPAGRSFPRRQIREPEEVRQEGPAAPKKHVMKHRRWEIDFMETWGVVGSEGSH